MKNTAEIFALLIVFVIVIGGAMFFSGKKFNFFSLPAFSNPQESARLSVPPSQQSQPVKSQKVPEKIPQTSPQEPLIKTDPLRSHYEGKISVQLYNYSNKVNDEYLTIYNISTSSIRITGWRIENQRGIWSEIPKAEAIPRSDGYMEDIILPPNGTAYIHTGARESGESFRENMCSGYLGELEKFSPPLSYSCPQRSSVEELYNRGFNSACIIFIRDQLACKAVDVVPYPKSAEIGSACVEYVNANLNYAGCVRAHRGDKDFFKDKWHVFFKRTEKLFDSVP